MVPSGFNMPWANGFGGDAVLEKMLATRFVDITVVLHGKEQRSRTLSVPADTTCLDLKGHLAVNGVVSTCSGLEVSLEEGGAQLADSESLRLSSGQTLHLRRAMEMVSVTAVVSGGDDEVFELIVPAEVTGAVLREHIAQSTSGALVVSAVMVPQDEIAMRELGDEELVQLVDQQAIIVQRVRPPTDAPAPPPAPPSSGLMSSVFARLRRRKGSQSARKAAAFGLRCASNVRVKGSKVSCTSSDAWASCAVFDVPDPKFFEISVKLLADAPHSDAEGATGRWMLGVVPTVFAATKTEKERRSLLNGGYFLTVCHGHPAKIRVPSMPRGTCGEDVDVVPGELRAGQTLTLRWTAGATATEIGMLTVQVDDMDPVSMPYAPPPWEDVRPCLVLGGKPTELQVLQLEPAGPRPVAGGA